MQGSLKYKVVEATAREGFIKGGILRCERLLQTEDAAWQKVQAGEWPMGEIGAVVKTQPSVWI